LNQQLVYLVAAAPLDTRIVLCYVFDEEGVVFSCERIPAIPAQNVRNFDIDEEGDGLTLA
jgi:hypothetical protein